MIRLRRARRAAEEEEAIRLRRARRVALVGDLGR